jgi:predicted metal-dependent peptidase
MLSFANKLRRARTSLAVHEPFLAHLSFHTPVYESTDGDTAWTDGKSVWFNPKFAEQLTPAEFTFVYAHELLHKAFLHVARLKERKHLIWNMATDYVINDILQDQANAFVGNSPFMSAPKGVLLDSRFKNMTAEQVYDLLMQEAEEHLKQIGINANDLRPGKDGMGGLSDAEIAEIKQQVASAAQAAKMQGKLPIGVARLVDQLLYPTRDWRNELLAFVQQFPADYGYAPPDRRFTDGEFFLPALQGEKIEIWVAIDTSGSIDKKTLTRFVSEVQGILSGFDFVHGKLITCDAQVHEVVDFASSDGMANVFNKLQLKGGGGTAFHPVWEIDGERPAACIYFTDGYGDFGNEPPFPVLWAVIENGLPLDKFPYGKAISVALEHL